MEAQPASEPRFQKVHSLLVCQTMHQSFHFPGTVIAIFPEVHVCLCCAPQVDVSGTSRIQWEICLCLKQQVSVASFCFVTNSVVLAPNEWRDASLVTIGLHLCWQCSSVGFIRPWPTVLIFTSESELIESISILWVWNHWIPPQDWEWIAAPSEGVQVSQRFCLLVIVRCRMSLTGGLVHCQQ